MRTRARPKHISGWTGPLYEEAEPDAVDPEIAGVGVLDDGLNWIARDGGRRVLRGGSAVALTLAAVSGQAISDVLAGFPFSPTGAVLVAHTSGGSKHYAYAINDTPAFALDTATPTEAESRLDIGWNSATKARPVGVELFEKMYLVDASESTTRQGLVAVHVSSGTWTLVSPSYDLDASGGSPGVLRAYAAEAYNGVLFVSGYDNESAPNNGTAPHLVRHSLLGTDPSDASNGFDPDAYAILGAKGQWVRAMKSGRTVMLVAKEHELYRISGQGAGLPGWQYQIQQVGQTVGAGATNPYALEHALGMWYGWGRTGPWRSNGENVELLRGGRDRSWRRTTNHHLAAVRYHPERRQVLFGVVETGLASTSAINRIWKWDLERDQWDVNDQYGTRTFHHLFTITQGITAAPSGIPGAPVQDFDYNAKQFGFTGGNVFLAEFTFTTADTGAMTEVWARLASGTSALQTTKSEALTRVILPLLSGTEPTYVKLRHLKSGVYSDFSTEAVLYPALRQPYLAVGETTIHDPISFPRTVPSLAINSQGVGMVPNGNLEVDSAGGTFAVTYLNDAGSLHQDTDTTVPNSETYTAELTNPAWPASIDAGPLGSAHMTLPNGALHVPNPAQVFYPPPANATSITLRFWPPKHGVTYDVKYALDGSGSFTTHGTITSAADGQPLAALEYTITGLTAGTKYDIVVEDPAGGIGSTSSFVDMWTMLPPPTSVTVTSNGSGTPVVAIDVDVPIAGKTVRVYNKDNSYDQAHASQPSGVQTYNSTVGTCGEKDEYFVRLHDATWPEHMRYSTAVSDTVDNPCAVGS